MAPVGNGCANSLFAAGANLSATGTASLGSDTLVIQGSGMPNSSALYFQGTAQAGGKAPAWKPATRPSRSGLHAPRDRAEGPPVEHRGP